MDSLDGVRNLDHIRPYRPFGDAIGLRLQPTILELRCLGLDVRFVQGLCVWMIIIDDNESCRRSVRGAICGISAGDAQESLNARVVKASCTDMMLGCRKRDHASMLENAACCIKRKSCATREQ